MGNAGPRKVSAAGFWTDQTLRSTPVHAAPALHFDPKTKHVSSLPNTQVTVCGCTASLITCQEQRQTEVLIRPDQLPPLSVSNAPSLLISNMFTQASPGAAYDESNCGDMNWKHAATQLQLTIKFRNPRAMHDHACHLMGIGDPGFMAHITLHMVCSVRQPGLRSLQHLHLSQRANGHPFPCPPRFARLTLGCTAAAAHRLTGPFL